MKGEYLSKFINHILSARNPASRLQQIGQKFGKWQWRHSLPTGFHCRIFVDVVVFLLIVLHSGQSFMSISQLYLKLWQFLFIRVLNRIPETAKKPCLKFVQYLGTEFGMNVSNGNYFILESWKVTVFTVFELFGKKKQGEGAVKFLPLPPLNLVLRNIL